MALSTKEKTIVSSVAVLVVIAIVVQFSFPLLNNNGNEDDGVVELTLLTNAGVMIEAKGMRVYIDPIDLPSEYGDLPADVVLVTHDHGDHYQESTINMLKKATPQIIPS